MCFENFFFSYSSVFLLDDEGDVKASLVEFCKYIKKREKWFILQTCCIRALHIFQLNIMLPLPMRDYLLYRKGKQLGIS